MKGARIKRIGASILLLAVATGITLTTFFYQRYGPFMGVHGNMCGPAEGGQLCIAPVLQAGWPLPYLFDSPTISVPEKLFLEDDLHVGFFALDICFFASLASLIGQGLAKRE